MSRRDPVVSVALLRELVAVDAGSGALTWKPRSPHHFAPTAKQTAEHKAANWNKRMAGKPALAYRDPRLGYLTGSIFNRHVSAHRVVFALTHGTWPAGEVDHINGKPADNRPANLRDVPHSENLKNAKRAANNTSGTTGVIFDSTHGKWVARIAAAGQSNRHVGCFVSKSDAVAARKAAEALHGYHPNHGREA